MSFTPCQLCDPPCYGDCRMGAAGYAQAARIAALEAENARLRERCNTIYENLQEARAWVRDLKRAALAPAPAPGIEYDHDPHLGWVMRLAPAPEPAGAGAWLQERIFADMPADPRPETRVSPATPPGSAADAGVVAWVDEAQLHALCASHRATPPESADEAAIQAGIAADPDTMELGEDWFARAEPATPPDSAALARVTRAIRETGGCGHASDDYTRCAVRDHCICEREALAAIEAMAATPNEPRP